MDPIDAVRLHGSIAAAARVMGIPRTTLEGHYQKAILAAGIDDVRANYQQVTRSGSKSKAKSFDRPPDVDPNLPIDEILDQASKRFRQLHKSEAAATWPVIKIHDPLPIGVLWFGDPHLGDNGCNIDLLRSHCKLVADTVGLYGANIGDTTNNWPTSGKLAAQWAKQDASISTEQRLAKWLMTESGVDWLLWLIGNHDAWANGAPFLRALNCNGIFMRDWEARFILEFPNAAQIKIHAAHNFKGFSDWNPMHGPLKASIKSSDADLYIAGHLHLPGSMQINLQGSGRFPLLLRVASYKRHDMYAKTGGFDDHDVGSAVLTVFNPSAKDRSGKITHFFDVEMGARYLTMLRGFEAAQLAKSDIQVARKSTKLRAPTQRKPRHGKSAS